MATRDVVGALQAGAGFLDEWTEPLEETQPPERLLDGAIVQPPSIGAQLSADHLPLDAAFRIVRWLVSEGRVNRYEAVTEPGGEAAWIQEAEEPGDCERLWHEAQVLAGIDDAMLPRLMACFEASERSYLATEPLPGPTLADAWSDGAMSVRQALPILAQVSVALGRLHACGWAHLALRPEAVLLTRPVKLLDVSRAVRLGERPPSPFYFAGYSAPELLAGEPVDARADVYGVGALLFRAVAGRSIDEAGADLIHGMPQATVPGLPQILHRCLGRRETRYQSAAALHQDLLTLARRLAPSTGIAIATRTTIGLEPTRATNQDAVAWLSGEFRSDSGSGSWAIVCVADGLGGLEAGEVAAEAAVRAVIAEASGWSAGPEVGAAEQAQQVRAWVHAANAAVCSALEARDARGGCTLLCAALRDRRLAVAHVGDGRLYRIRGAETTLLSRDHSLAMAQAMQGQAAVVDVRRHPGRSQLTRSLGDRRPLPDHLVDTLETAVGSPTLELWTGDVLLLCTDGLWEPVLDVEMAEIVQRHAPDLDAAAEALIQLALERGAPDNATVALTQLRDS